MSILNRLAADLGGKIETVSKLPDGSGFATMSFPLPKGHWLTKDSAEYESPPMPFRMGTDNPERRVWAERLRIAGMYALRGATDNGKITDYDPDAVLQNLVVGMLGYHTADGLSTDSWANPKEQKMEVKL